MLRLICLVALVWWSKAEPLSEDERGRILEVHRKIREEVEPPASNMMLMNYSVELEKMAEKWLRNCTYPLPSGSIHPEYKDVEAVLQFGKKPEEASFEPASKFDGEKETYNYERNTCTSLCGNYRRQCTELTTPGAVPYASEPPEDLVATDSLEKIEPPIQAQTGTSTTKMPLIQTQKMLSPTVKPLILTLPATSPTKRHKATIAAEVPLELVQKQSGDASMLQSQASPIETDQLTSQSQTTTSISKRLSAVNALLSAFIAVVFLA
uniref:SCP domain-containing protein n=1 Tax=Mesocestoides corti TaxID=53468 RepID=A0A5K3FA96_MESCO